MVMQVLGPTVSRVKEVSEAVCLRPTVKKPRPHPVLAPGELPSRYFAYPKGSLQCKNGNHYSCTNQ